MVYVCEICSASRVPFRALSIPLILNHYRRVHGHDPNFQVTCRLHGCSATYKKFEGCKSHLRRHHIDHNDILQFQHFDQAHVHFQTQNPEPEEDGITNSNNENFIERVNETDSGYEHVNINQEYGSTATETQIDLQRNSALFLLKTKEVNQLTQQAIDSLDSDTTDMVKTTVEVLKNEVRNCLERAGIQFDGIPGLDSHFKDDKPVSNPFHGLQAKTKQLKYFRDNFGVVVS